MKFRLIIDRQRDEEVVATVHERTALTDEIERIVTGKRLDSLAVYADDEIRILPFEETECIAVMGGKVFAIDLKGEKYIIRKRLYEVEEILPDYFIKINKSAIANRRRIEKFTLSFSGSVNVIFKSGYEDYVSRRCFAEIKRRFLNE